MSALLESDVEEAALAWLRELGYTTLHGPDIAPGEPSAERGSYSDVLLEQRLRLALARLNPSLPHAALDEAYRKLILTESPSPLLNNRAFHTLLVDGVTVEYRAADGSIASAPVRLLDAQRPENNDFVAVNQFTVIENGHNRRPDIVVFVNGLPLAVIELKNAANEDATIWHAFNQLQTYKQQIPSLFTTNAVLVISDGLNARLGSLTADTERFMPWRTIAGQEPAPSTLPQLEVLLRGVFAPERFIDLVRHFVVFEDDGAKLVKKIAGYHQFHAVRAAVQETERAASGTGDRRGGVVWHTQGSGKSLTMVFYAGRIILSSVLENPTLVVLTDRNDLDDQLFDTFARCADLLRQTPQQAEDRAHLRDLLKLASGGVVFTTIQKFTPDTKGDTYPLLSDRRNIVVIADEAHRSQYGFDAKLDQKTGTLSYGYAQHIRDALPNATFIGFTGTPIELTDKNTRAVFGDYISIYDIQRAVEDGATVPIYYEGRLAKLALKDEERPRIDPEFEEVTEGAEERQREQIKRKWAQLEAMVGAPHRLALVAEDIVQHWEARLSTMHGKAMIVAMSRRVAAELYQSLVKLRPEWHSDDDKAGTLKVVITGSASDDAALQPHIRTKAGREQIAKRFKNPDDPLQIVIVRDMWLTGFDAPSLHTMYIDKPMHGHNLMQAIARVNRVFRGKPGGLIVDYLGIADQLKAAMSNYTASGGRGNTALDQNEAVAVMLEKFEICRHMLHGFDYSRFITGTPAERLSLLPAAQEHILLQPDGKARFLAATQALSQAFALAVPHEAAIRIRDDVTFFQTVRAGLSKTEPADGRSSAEMDHAVRQIVSRSVVADQVIDIFSAAGLQRPDVSILSDEFLAEVHALPYKNLAVEALNRLLQDQLKVRARSNLIQSKRFSEMLERALRGYQNRSVETARVLTELIELAKEIRAAQNRGEELGLTDDELAFYDALEVNDSAVSILGDDQLRDIARELVRQVKANTTIDWNLKDSIRARLRTIVKRVLRKYGYPPDKQEQATTTIIRQAEMFAATWAA
jgi:type I restriction enzyme R subunit